MIRKLNLSVLSLALVATLFIAACGGGGSHGNKAAFCRDNATLNSKANKITSVASAVSIFRANLATVDDFGKQAPDDIKADAAKLVAAAHTVAQTGSIKAFSDKATSAAGDRVDSYCAKGGATTTTT